MQFTAMTEGIIKEMKHLLNGKYEASKLRFEMKQLAKLAMKLSFQITKI